MSPPQVEPPAVRTSWTRRSAPVPQQRRTSPMAPGPRLYAATSARSTPASRSLLARWHLLSLDAPTVAAVWTAFFPWSIGIAIPWLTVAAMFLGVWLLYAADRLLDARPRPDGSAPPDLEERHRFHWRHRRAFVLVGTVAGALLLGLLLRLDRITLVCFALLGSLLAGHLLLVHRRPGSGTTRGLPKELAVGLFFPAATSLPAAVRAPALLPALLPAILLFAGVCTLNGLLIHAWEHVPPASAPPARLTSQPRTLLLATAALTLVAGVLAVFARPVSASLGAPGSTPLRLPALACAGAGALLFCLHGQQRRFDPTTLRALADAVLLTPVPLAFLAWSGCLHRIHL